MSAAMTGECFKHNLEWYDAGVVECPVCAAETELAAKNEAIEAARSLIDDFLEDAGRLDEPEFRDMAWTWFKSYSKNFEKVKSKLDALK